MTATKANETDGGASAAIDIAAGLVLVALATFALVWLIPTHVTGKSAGSDVSPAFFPTVAATIVLVLSLGMVAHRLIRSGHRGGWLRGQAILKEIGAVVIYAVVVAVLLPAIGFVATAALVIIAGGVIARYQKWRALIVLAIVYPLLVRYGAWAIFTVELP